MQKTILIVDDSQAVRSLLQMTLRQDGYSIIQCANGKEALNELQGTDINLIISDVNMPEMDGLSFARSVRENQKYRFTPIIMLTTENHESIKMEGMAAGVRAWLVKPFGIQQIRSAVEKLVR